MAFILQIVSSFSAESFISADTSLQNTSASVSQGWRWEVFGREGLDQLWWQHQPMPPVCFAPKVRGPSPACSCQPPGQPGVAAPCPRFRQVGAPSEQGSGDAAVLPVCPAPVSCVCFSQAPQPMVGTRLQCPLISLLPCWPGQSSFPGRSLLQE